MSKSMNHYGDEFVGVVANGTKIDPALADDLRLRLEDAGVEYVWRDVPKASAATKAVARLLKDGATGVIVAGGDGTVRAASAALAGSSVPLTVLPTGTANLFARAMELPNDAAGTVDMLVHGRNRTIDLGQCNDLTFSIMAGTGIDAALLDGAEATKDRLGVAAYVASAVKQARQRRQFETRVSVDGLVCFEGMAAGVLVANIGTLIGGLDVLPDASPTDGRLDVAVLTAVGWREWTSLAAHAFGHSRHTPGLIRVGQGCKVKVTTTSEQRFEVDGGVKGKSKRLDVRVLAGALVVRVPASPDS